MNMIIAADIKEPEKIAIVKGCLNNIIQGSTEPMRKPVPSGTNVFSNKAVPAELADLIRDEQKNLSEYERGHKFTAEYDAAALLYDAWKHRDVDWCDCFSYRIKTDFGVKTFTYINEHPSISELEEMRNGFKEFYLNEIAEGNSDEHIINMIAGEVADRCLGEDYIIFFNEELDRLPEDMRASFIADAEKVLTELKQK